MTSGFQSGADAGFIANRTETCWNRQRIGELESYNVGWRRRPLRSGVVGDVPPMAKRFDNVYQFHVVLQGIRPPIWRRIQVPGNYSFWDLHVAIQDAMGWWDSHLHAFRVANPSHGDQDLIGIPDEDRFVGDPEYLPGWTVPIDKYFTKPGDSARYEYDFGDGWEHEIVLDESMPREPKVKYPRCLAGERACPPEDCGGPWGYENMLKILADPSHEEHDEMLTWVGGSYDPRLFDLEKVRFDDPRKRWKTAFAEP